MRQQQRTVQRRRAPSLWELGLGWAHSNVFSEACTAIRPAVQLGDPIRRLLPQLPTFQGLTPLAAELSPLSGSTSRASTTTATWASRAGAWRSTYMSRPVRSRTCRQSLPSPTSAACAAETAAPTRDRHTSTRTVTGGSFSCSFDGALLDFGGSCEHVVAEPCDGSHAETISVPASRGKQHQFRQQLGRRARAVNNQLLSPSFSQTRATCALGLRH